MDPAKKATKRGRKLTEPTQYFNDSQRKITEWKKYLQTGLWSNGKQLSEKDILDLRNRISALKSRVSKKLELAGLEDEILRFKNHFKFVLKTLNDEMSNENKSKV